MLLLRIARKKVNDGSHWELTVSQWDLPERHFQKLTSLMILRLFTDYLVTDMTQPTNIWNAIRIYFWSKLCWF